jgi:predicted porin
MRSRMQKYLFCLALVAIGSVATLAADFRPAEANESGSSPTAVVAQTTSSPAPAAADDISDLKTQMEVIKAKLDLLEAQQEQQAKMAADLTTQQADAAAKAKKDAASSVHTSGTAGTSIRLYGLIEPTLFGGTNFSRSGASAIGIPVSWFSGNRWGLDINQKIGNVDAKPAPNRLDLIAKLESEFELASGNMDTPGVLFNRDAWVGVQSKTFGKLTIGRQDTLPRDVAGNWGDPYGVAELTTNEGNFTNVNDFKQLIFYMGGGTGAGGQGDTRYDSAIVWKKVFDSGLFLAGAYNFGDANGPGGPNGSGPIPGAEFNKGSSAAVGIGFNAGRFHPSAFYTTVNVLGRAIAAANSAVPVVGYQDQSFGIGGNYDWGKYRLNAGFLYYTGDQGSLGRRYDKAWTTSAKFAPTKRVDYELGVQEFYSQNAAVNGAGYVLRPFVDFTGSLSSGLAGSTSTVPINGSRFTVYGSVIVHPMPNVDLYLAGDDLLTGGGYLDSRANGFKHQVETASGVRFKF